MKSKANKKVAEALIYAGASNLHNTQGTHIVWPKLIQITQGLAEEGSLLAESF